MLKIIRVKTTFLPFIVTHMWWLFVYLFISVYRWIGNELNLLDRIPSTNFSGKIFPYSSKVSNICHTPHHVQFCISECCKAFLLTSVTPGSHLFLKLPCHASLIHFSQAQRCGFLSFLCSSTWSPPEIPPSWAWQSYMEYTQFGKP